MTPDLIAAYLRSVNEGRAKEREFTDAAAAFIFFIGCVVLAYLIGGLT